MTMRPFGSGGAFIHLLNPCANSKIVFLAPRLRERASCHNGPFLPAGSPFSPVSLPQWVALPRLTHETHEPAGFWGSGLPAGFPWVHGPAGKREKAQGNHEPAGFWVLGRWVLGQFGLGVLGEGAREGRAPTGSGTEAPRTIFYFFKNQRTPLPSGSTATR